MQIKCEKFAEAAGNAASLKERLAEYKATLKEATAELDIVAVKYKEEQLKRKKLLNELEDIKGKVRVYCRVRPFSKTEASDPEKAKPCYVKHDEFSMTVGLAGRPKDYIFDTVFGEDST